MANTGPKSATTRSESSTKESPAVVKEIPKQSSKDVKANSRKPVSRSSAKIPASQLKQGRSRMMMLRKGERTTEGRPTPREIKRATAGINAAKIRADRRDQARRVARGLPARNSDPIIRQLRVQSPPVMTRRQKDILNRTDITPAIYKKNMELLQRDTSNTKRRF